MPYGRRYRRRPGPRRRRPRRPLRRLAKRVYRRKSATAQAGQIAQIARHVSDLKSTVRGETELHASYQQDLGFFVKPLQELTQNPQVTNVHGICVIPLTSGPNSVIPQPPAPGVLPATYPSATSNVVLADTVGTATSAQYGNMKWTSWLKPRTAAQTNWIKMYRQTVKLRLDANHMPTCVDYNVYIFRAARSSHGETNSSNTIMQLAQKLDGEYFKGYNDDGFKWEDDFVSSAPIVPVNAAADGGTQIIIDTQGGGATSQPIGGGDNFMWNKAYFDVVAHRRCTLGPRPNGRVPAPESAEPGEILLMPSTLSATAQADNQSHQEMSFSVDYGGAKLSAVDPAGGVDQLADIRYDQINPKLKHWLVIVPNLASSRAVAYASLQTVTSCKVPA